MESNESVDLGKKVFFLNPPFDFKKIIIPILSDLEYEIYVISSYKYAKETLRNYPDSICFVCIDGEMPISYWYNFVVSCNNDLELSSVCLGVMSAHAGASDRNHFLLNALIPAGFVSLVSKKDELLSKIEGILRINNAKGIRKYVRVDCSSDKLIQAQCKINDEIYPLRIANISSAGLLCITKTDMAPLFSVNMLIRDFVLVLRSQKIKCNAVILKSFISEGRLYLVMLFTKGLPHVVKTSIQAYIRFFLQNSIDSKINTIQPDTTDYSKLHEAAIAAEIDEAFLISVEDEIKYVEEVEGITYADEAEDADAIEPPIFGKDDEKSLFSQLKYLDPKNLETDGDLIDDIN